MHLWLLSAGWLDTKEERYRLCTIYTDTLPVEATSATYNILSTCVCFGCVLFEKTLTIPIAWVLKKNTILEQSLQGTATPLDPRLPYAAKS